jgi:hypothetical protein
MKKALIGLMALGLGVQMSCGQMMKSITHTTTATNDLIVTVETNTQYAIYSIAVAFTNIATGDVTIAHNRGSYSVSPLKSMTINGSNSAVCYFDAPYLIDGKQGDTLTISTTDTTEDAKLFMTIFYY